MECIRVAHCADLHLGASFSYLNARAGARQAEQMLTFEKIINFCRENKADILLIAGDLFDTPTVDPALARQVFSTIATIPDTVVAISAGNHDPITIDSPYQTEKLPDNLFVFGESISAVHIPEKNTNIYGISFTSPSFSKHLILPTVSDDNINLLVLHADLGGDINGRYNSVSSSQLEASRMDYIALGHIHKPTEIISAGNTFYSYPGSPEPLGFDETGERGIYFGEVGRGINKMQFIPISKRRFEEVNVDISGASSSSEIIELILSTLKNQFQDSYINNFYRIILNGAIPQSFVPDISYITTFLNEQIYFLKIKDRTSFEINYESLAKEFTLRGIFVKRMLDRIDKAKTTEEKELCRHALNLGLRAFDSEVKPDET